MAPSPRAKKRNSLVFLKLQIKEQESKSLKVKQGHLLLGGCGLLGETLLAFIGKFIGLISARKCVHSPPAICI